MRHHIQQDSSWASAAPILSILLILSKSSPGRLFSTAVEAGAQWYDIRHALPEILIYPGKQKDRAAALSAHG